MTNLPKPRYLPAGESALVVEFGDTIDPKIHDRVLALDAALQQANFEGVIETVPTYRSLMIHFDPRRLTTEGLADALFGLDYASAPPRTRQQRWRIPACYDPPHGEDIAEVAALFDLPRARIIDLHQGARYRVYMYGFAPGFTFLGGLPQELTIPRRAVPRLPAPPGSLLIAGGQALIAGCAMPTGWYGIGRTPVKMFDPRREQVFLAGIGDEICFERIDPAAFDAMSTVADTGEFCARHEYLHEYLGERGGRLRVLRAGPGATVQDGGRHGYLRYGVTTAGPMDWVAFRTANLALGNGDRAAAIEVSTGGFEVICEGAPLALAFAGGAFAWRRDGVLLPIGARLLLQPGEVLAARAGDFGAFAYLAVEGGFETPVTMGSRTTHTRSAMGGIEGRMLRAGDVLPAASTRRLDGASFEATIDAPWLAREPEPLRVVLGPQDDYFAAETLSAFFAGAFTLTPMADRMAYRLDGPEIAHALGYDIVSDGVALGAIQIAGDMKPLVLMADRQPTGGYPKLGHVARADIGRLAQMRPGENCCFRAASVAEARAALFVREDEIAATVARLLPLRRALISETLFAANLIGGVVDPLEERADRGRVLSARLKSLVLILKSRRNRLRQE